MSWASASQGSVDDDMFVDLFDDDEEANESVDGEEEAVNEQEKGKGKKKDQAKTTPVRVKEEEEADGSRKTKSAKVTIKDFPMANLF